MEQKGGEEENGLLSEWLFQSLPLFFFFLGYSSKCVHVQEGSQEDFRGKKQHVILEIELDQSKDLCSKLCRSNIYHVNNVNKDKQL